MIAHRISSALRARRVLVLDGGDAVLGTHEQLLAQSAVYRDLVGFWQPGPSVTAHNGRSGLAGIHERRHSLV